MVLPAPTTVDGVALVGALNDDTTFDFDQFIITPKLHLVFRGLRTIVKTARLYCAADCLSIGYYHVGQNQVFEVTLAVANESTACIQLMPIGPTLFASSTFYCRRRSASSSATAP